MNVVKMLAGETVSGARTLNPMIFCPACRCGHLFPVTPDNAPEHRWAWNGSMDKPTFTLPNWLFVIFAWPVDLIVHQPFRWIFTKPVSMNP